MDLEGVDDFSDQGLRTGWLSLPCWNGIEVADIHQSCQIDICADDLNAIHRSALELNSLDGISGLLIFNGTHFLQIVEGAQTAIDDLLARLRRDSRHSGLEVRDERRIESVSFPDWAMELVRVNAAYFEARETLKHRIPKSVSKEVRNRLYKMTQRISSTIELYATR